MQNVTSLALSPIFHAKLMRFFAPFKTRVEILSKYFGVFPSSSLSVLRKKLFPPQTMTLPSI